MDSFQAEMNAIRENMKTNQAKMDINIKEMKELILSKKEFRIEANNENFDVLQESLVSRIDADQ
jgi:hypothetical protein